MMLKFFNRRIFFHVLQYNNLPVNVVVQRCSLKYLKSLSLLFLLFILHCLVLVISLVESYGKFSI